MLEINKKFLSKQLHVWLDHEDFTKFANPSDFLCVSHARTITSLKRRESIIHTTCTHFLTFDMMELGYRLFVHLPGNKIHEIKIGDNDWTDRELRFAHNLERLLYAGAMGELIDWNDCV